MNIEILPNIKPNASVRFAAKHPMFRYQVDRIDSKIKSRLRRAKFVVVVGLGGSALPLKAFVDFFQLSDRVLFLDTVDPDRWNRFKKLKGAIFCVVSKSGETLEIKALLAELVAARRLKDTLIVTDSESGLLRRFATDHKLMTLSIPRELGGRFTNFSPFHRAILEAWGVPFSSLLEVARFYALELEKNPQELANFFHQLFEAQKSILVLWSYSERLLGLAQWAQQVIAESLGKKNERGQRFGITPIVLQGPQDQHSVLQLLMDGPQDKVLWFLEGRFSKPTKKRTLKAPLDDFQRLGLSESLKILCESTFETFRERLSNSETAQPVSRFLIESTKDFIRMIVLIQALTEYAADRLGVNAFDQPGVERGKQIARELIRRGSQR